jgi:predicted MFS family arabinose efflux permease
MLICGVLAQRLGWRIPLFGLAGLAVLALVVITLTLPAERPPRPPTGRALRELWLARQAAARLYVFAFGEGMVMLGAFPLIVPALRLLGQGAAGTGATMGAYGLAAVAAMAAFGRIAAGGPNRPVLAGGLLLVCGLTLAIMLPALPLVLAALASACLGAAFSLFHSRFQAMATQVVPGARGLGIGLFAGIIFSGAAVGTGAGTALAGRVGFPAVFAALTLVAAAMLVAGYRLARRA